MSKRKEEDNLWDHKWDKLKNSKMQWKESCENKIIFIFYYIFLSSFNSFNKFIFL